MLRPKQENFCNYYVECGNQSEAYRRAYPSSLKWKDETVWKRASELLKNGEVLGRVTELQTEAKKKSDIKKEDAIRILANIANLNIRQIGDSVSGEFKIKSLTEIPDEALSCIQSIKSTSQGLEIKFYSKIEALGRLSRMLGWEANTGDNNLNIRVIVGDE